MSRGLSTRYARALADLAIEEGKVDQVGNQLEEFSRILEENPSSKSLFLPRPDLEREEQILLLTRLLDTLQMERLVRSFLLLLLGKGMFSLLPQICLHYGELADAQMNRVKVALSVPILLAQEDLHMLQEAFRKRIGKEVVIEQRQDPSLLGGWLAQVGSSELWDASVKGELERLKSRLVRNEEAL